MAKQQPPRRPAQPQNPTPQVKKTAPAPARRSAEKKDGIFTGGSRVLIYGRRNFIYMGAGLALVLLGLVLMSGGAMPDPKVWEADRIYSFRRITLAPIAMVAGFIAIVFGIFKTNQDAGAADILQSDNTPEA
jgi:Protein of unknown function (DUF3098)